ncbi:hypothetical protein AVEN_98731-1 [Araneus ventricosus]|uniref:Uncharacterized protein n=1 Tax=Araneus ventricosus TaxID=182803 RepID=A0A4Y2TQS3_ARAVE|nr:hypothetical protein AVEN_98731-1 [Araneus ventricosus]
MNQNTCSAAGRNHRPYPLGPAAHSFTQRPPRHSSANAAAATLSLHRPVCSSVPCLRRPSVCTGSIGWGSSGDGPGTIFVIKSHLLGPCYSSPRPRHITGCCCGGVSSWRIIAFHRLARAASRRGSIDWAAAPGVESGTISSIITGWYHRLVTASLLRRQRLRRRHRHGGSRPSPTVFRASVTTDHGMRTRAAIDRNHRPYIWCILVHRGYRIHHHSAAALFPVLGRNSSYIHRVSPPCIRRHRSVRMSTCCGIGPGHHVLLDK